MTVSAETDRTSSEVPPAGRGIVVLAWILAVGTVVFAVVNVVFELTGRFDGGSLDEYAAGLSIANWLVAGLKVLGAGVAVLSVARRPPWSRFRVNLLIWAAAATLGVYALGSVVQAIGLATGVMGSADQVTATGVAYVAGFVVAAVGFGVLAVSHSRRSGLGVRPALLGAVGGVLVVGLILFALPWLLTATGVFPG